MIVRIAVVSDTHLARPSEACVEVFENFLRAADMLLHLGDITGEECLGLFMTHPCFFGVSGNMDPPDFSPVLPCSRIVPVRGIRIGMAHGWGFGPDPAARLAEFFQGRADMVCFGHTHRRFHGRTDQGMVLLNPGSLFHPRDDQPGFAWIHMDGQGPPRIDWQDL